ncbi:hypothetical protein CALCODRAFT_179472 [Calocera cornea HHB12733]|uniref:F-box domain-containing protein n=1 Tax=Calocera cornea HHB12733 TaxID=1353952 RepID=A0A165CCY1_9BASI|nr:hypothetical protein CALCODRAFT_179472 [Calocera cornea HHB12733]
MPLLCLPDELLLLVRAHLPPTILAYLVFSHTCRRLLHLSSESSWRALLFRLRLGRPLCNVRGRRPGWRQLAVMLMRHGSGCQRAGCKSMAYIGLVDMDTPGQDTGRMVDLLTDQDAFRFHPLHFTVHGHPTSDSHDAPYHSTSAHTAAGGSGADGTTVEHVPQAPAYSLTLPRVLQAHLPFPSYPGRAVSTLSTLAQLGSTQRYAPLCHHPNASCTLATWPPARELHLPFRVLGERRVIGVKNEDGVTLLDLSRALVDALLAEPDDAVLNTVMETYGARDDVVSFGLVEVLRDRGFMNDHEWPLIELLDEYDYGEASWDGYRSWVDNVRGA